MIVLDSGISVLKKIFKKYKKILSKKRKFKKECRIIKVKGEITIENNFSN